MTAAAPSARFYCFFFGLDCLEDPKWKSAPQLCVDVARRGVLGTLTILNLEFGFLLVFETSAFFRYPWETFKNRLNWKIRGINSLC